jgi:hypothetical protein
VLRGSPAILLLVVITGAACTPLAVRPADERPIREWLVFNSPDGRFSIRLPGEPRAKRSDSGVTYYVNIAKYDLYQVSVGPLPAETRSFDPQKLLDATRDRTIKQYVKSGSAQLVSSEDGSTEGKPSSTDLVEFKSSSAMPHSMMLVRLIIDSERNELIMVSHSVLAEHFVRANSFDFIDSLRLNR